jgi:hypothetical protein
MAIAAPGFNNKSNVRIAKAVRWVETKRIEKRIPGYPYLAQQQPFQLPQPTQQGQCLCAVSDNQWGASMPLGHSMT